MTDPRLIFVSLIMELSRLCCGALRLLQQWDSEQKEQYHGSQCAHPSIIIKQNKSQRPDRKPQNAGELLLLPMGCEGRGVRQNWYTHPMVCHGAQKGWQQKRRLELGLTHAFFAQWVKRQPCVLLVVPWQNVQPCLNKLAYLGEQVPNQLVLSGYVLDFNQSINYSTTGSASLHGIGRRLCGLVVCSRAVPR